MKAAFLLAVLALSLAGCDDMARQPRHSAYNRSSLFANGAAMQAPPTGAVSQDERSRAQALATRPAMTSALLARGQERYGIYCAVCHGALGDGDGIVPSRGFPHPPSFHQARLRAAPSRHFVDVIGNGYGVMYAYGDRVAPADRWAIAAYIRALQLSQAAPVAALPPDDRARIELSHDR
jgi:mono/diheme cytochrome c family protein